MTCKAAAAATEEAAVIDVKNLENELGLCTKKGFYEYEAKIEQI